MVCLKILTEKKEKIPSLKSCNISILKVATSVSATMRYRWWQNRVKKKQRGEKKRRQLFLTQSRLVQLEPSMINRHPCRVKSCKHCSPGPDATRNISQLSHTSVPRDIQLNSTPSILHHTRFYCCVAGWRGARSRRRCDPGGDW